MVEAVCLFILPSFCVLIVLYKRRRRKAIKIVYVTKGFISRLPPPHLHLRHRRGRSQLRIVSVPRSRSLPTTYETVQSKQVSNSIGQVKSLTTATEACLPVKRVLAFGSEEIDVILELQLEYVVLVDVVRLAGYCDRVAEEWQAGERKLVLISLVEEEAKVGEDHPQLLPSVAILELAQQIAAELVDHRSVIVRGADTCVAVPANVHCCIGSVLRVGLRGRVAFGRRE